MWLAQSGPCDSTQRVARQGETTLRGLQEGEAGSSARITVTLRAVRRNGPGVFSEYDQERFSPDSHARMA